MSKKKNKKSDISDEALAAFRGGSATDNGLDPEILRGISDLTHGKLSDDEKEIFTAMFSLAVRGVTPDDYAQFYRIFEMSGVVAENLYGENSDSEEEDFFPFFGNGFGRKRSQVKEYEPLKDDSEHTLVLKIQMKDVTKPPMWREVEIPADYDFWDLHQIIQEVTGLSDYHLWQFNKKAYDSSLQIGIEMDESGFGPGLDYITHDAEETLLTQFLQKKGDKLEYVYDFGDDWIFTVEVKDLIEKTTEHPVCRKFKSELNAIEDFGGTWTYINVREDLDNWDKYPKKKREQRAKEMGFDSSDEYIDFISQHRISLDELNEVLAGI